MSRYMNATSSSVTIKVETISNEYIVLTFQHKKIDVKSAWKTLEQNVNEEKIVCCKQNH